METCHGVHGKNTHQFRHVDWGTFTRQAVPTKAQICNLCARGCNHVTCPSHFHYCCLYVDVYIPNNQCHYCCLYVNDYIPNHQNEHCNLAQTHHCTDIENILLQEGVCIVQDGSVVARGDAFKHKEPTLCFTRHSEGIRLCDNDNSSILLHSLGVSHSFAKPSESHGR